MFYMAKLRLPCVRSVGIVQNALDPSDFLEVTLSGT